MKNVYKTLIVLVIFTLTLVVGNPVNSQTSEDLEVVGSVEAMTLNTITVNQLEIDVTSAEMNIPIEVGTIVEVIGELSTNGTITAHEVNAVDDEFELGEAEIIGLLESFDGTTMLINGQTIDVSEADVQDGITFGGFVLVHAILKDDDDVWIARSAESFVASELDDELDEGELILIGTLEVLGNQELTVAGQPISIDATETEIQDILIVGVRVKVRVRITNDEWLALEIENSLGRNEVENNTNSNSNQNNNANDNRNSNANSNDNSASTNPSISEQAAVDMVLEIYPNTRVISINLLEKFGGTLVWEVQTSHGIELNINAESGVILSIQRRNDANNNVNTNLNNNNNFNINQNDNNNDNGNFNSNQNHNTNSNDNNNTNDDDDDDDN